MKVLLGVVLIAFVAQASAQTRPELRCFECIDCSNVDQNTFVRECYGQVTNPGTQTPPATISLTPVVLGTTRAVQPNQPQETTQQPQQPQQPPQPPQLPLQPPQQLPQQPQQPLEQPQQPVQPFFEGLRDPTLFTCFVMRTQVDNRQIISRGCALTHRSKQETCSHHNQGIEPLQCALCVEDECNRDVTLGAGQLFASASLILATLFIALRLN